MEAIFAIMVQLLVVSLPLVIYYLMFKFFGEALKDLTFKDKKTVYDYFIAAFSVAGFIWALANVIIIILEFRGHV